MRSTALKAKYQTLEKPVLSEFPDPADFVAAMLSYLKETEEGYSVLSATKNLRHLSPSLVSLVIKKKRKLSLDRLDDFAKLLRLDAVEKMHLKKILLQKENGGDSLPEKSRHLRNTDSVQRKEASVHLLNDWINPYVKDCFHFASFQSRPDLVVNHLSMLASPQRINRAIDFLLKQGHLRCLIDGRIVVETHLTITESPLPNKKIRNFHRHALRHAEKSLELFSIHERLANTLLMPLDEERYQDLLNLISDFNEKAMKIADQEISPESRLYQLIINLSPVGGKSK